MPAQASENGAARVSPMDQRGRPISPPVLSAAEELSPCAIHHAEKLLVDPAVAANLLEEAAATVSRALKAKNARIRRRPSNTPAGASFVSFNCQTRQEVSHTELVHHAEPHPRIT